MPSKSPGLRSRAKHVLLALLTATALCGPVFSQTADQSKKGKKEKAKAAATAAASSAARKPIVTVVDGVVQPRRPMADAIADAIQFLRRADGSYVPGSIQGDLAGYFMAAHVNADGSRVSRQQLSFPARHHAYFIRTFLHYYVYTGEREWLLRARDLADWNTATSTPATDTYGNLPYSSHEGGVPTGSADKNSIETDKPAFLGTSYLALYESTGERKYFEAARKIAATLVPKQRADGSWPFRVIPKDGAIFEDLGGAPVFFVEFFEAMQRHEPRPEYQRARDLALKLMIARNVEKGEWGTYHEDIHPKDGTHLSAEPMSFTAAYLFRHAHAYPDYIAYGKRVIAQMEARLVHTEGHAASPAPGVAEQAAFEHIMAGHTARYCLALGELYAVTGDPAVRLKALSGLNAVTHMQSEIGLFRTYFYDTEKKAEKDPATVRNWYSQHLYAVCHMLECMAIFPEIAPKGQDHILGYSSGLNDVRYASGRITYATALPATEVVKVKKEPKSVLVNGRALRRDGKEQGWSFDAAKQVVVVRHAAGEVTIEK